MFLLCTTMLAVNWVVLGFGRVWLGNRSQGPDPAHAIDVCRPRLGLAHGNSLLAQLQHAPELL